MKHEHRKNITSSRLGVSVQFCVIEMYLLVELLIAYIKRRESVLCRNVCD